MPAAVQPVDPPARHTFSRVLRRYDRTPSMHWRFAAYSVNLTAKPVMLAGRVAPTLFFPANPGGVAAARRAEKLGWKDETEAFDAELAAGAAPVAEAPLPARLRGAELQAHVEALTWTDFLALADDKIEAPVHRSRGRAAITVDLLDALETAGGLAVV